MQFRKNLTAAMLIVVSVVVPLRSPFVSSALADDGNSVSNLPRDLVQNTLRISTTPATAGILLILGVTPAVADDETNRLYRPWLENQKVDHFFELGEWMGSGSIHALSSMSLYSSGKLLNKESWSRLGSEMFSAQFLSSVLSTSLKLTTARTRPDGAPYSFPSGHTTVSFATAGVIWHNCGKTAGVTAQALAAYVALSRLQENKHYVSDIVAGCVLGNYVAYMVSRDTDPTGSNIKIRPMVNGSALGITFSKRF